MAVGCFTEDGAFSSTAAGDDPGAARITNTRMRMPRRAGPPLTTDLLYEVDRDVATGRSASVATLALPPASKILGSGEVQDRLIKQDGQWCIAYRRLRNDRLVSDPSGKRRRCRRRRGRRSPSRGRAPARNPDERHVGATS